MLQNKSRVRPLIVGFVVLAAAVYSIEGRNRCPLTKFEVNYADGSSYCHDCPVCPAGSAPSHSCGEKISPEDLKNLHCSSCVLGKTYSPSNDTSPCYQCSATCPKDQVVLQNCSVTADKKCGDVKCEQGLYYETSTADCQECSRCCGDEHDVRKEECIERGMPKARSCSVHHKYRCQPITVKFTETGTTVATWSTTLKATAKVTESLHSQKALKTSVACLLAIVFLTMVVAVIIKRKKLLAFRRGSWSKCPIIVAEGGVLADQTDLQDVDTNAMVTSVRYAKSDSVNVLIPLNEQVSNRLPVVQHIDQFWEYNGLRFCQANRPLMAACANAGQDMATNEGMTLTQFSSTHYRAFEEVCELLDIKVKGCGNYEQVAKHYGIPDRTIQSRLKTDQDGPSKAMFANLASSSPELTVGEFVLVLKKIKRKDVVRAFQAS